MSLDTSHTTPVVKQQKILVIDDEEVFRTAISISLKSMGYEIFEANNGVDGLTAVKTYKPDLIVCDINMPKMDGLTMLGKLKEEIEFAMIPFIFLTGNVANGDLRKGMQRGADDYLEKPFAMDDLVSAIETRLTKKKSMQKYYDFQLEDIKTSIVMSLPHEFRTPLSSILGLSEILTIENDLPSDEVREIGKLINRSGERLHCLLENLVLFGQLQFWMNDQETIEKLRREYATTLSDIILAAVEKKTAKHDRAGAISISIKNCHVRISSVYLAKIMEELIDNALKFSEKGTKIYITNEQNDNVVYITIQDRGRGMSHEQINKVSAFLQFERRYFEQQGAGLGLVIAKALAELHGGNLTIVSTEKIGTTVTLQLPKVQQ